MKADLSWRAAGLSTITSAASLSALLALCSPSAAITLARASLEQGMRTGCCGGEMLIRWGDLCVCAVRFTEYRMDYNTRAHPTVLAASASAAMALWRDSGTLTSFTSTLSTVTPQGSVASSRVV